MKQIILITGASSGFGLLTARALADAGHAVYASMRDIAGRNAAQADAVRKEAAERNVDLRVVELDVTSDDSAQDAIDTILRNDGRLDVLVHNAGHMVFGPAEAFTAEQYAQLYDVNVLGTQRVNRAALPAMRRQRKGLVLWVSSSSTRGGTPPFLAPYFAAKAAMDSLAVSYSGELTRWGIETSIMVPGAFTKGTNHFAHAGKPADGAREAEYMQGSVCRHAGEDTEGPREPRTGRRRCHRSSAQDRGRGEPALRQAPVPRARGPLAGRRGDRQRRRRSRPPRAVLARGHRRPAGAERLSG